MGTDWNNEEEEDEDFDKTLATYEKLIEEIQTLPERKTQPGKTELKQEVLHSESDDSEESVEDEKQCFLSLKVLPPRPKKPQTNLVKGNARKFLWSDSATFASNREKANEMKAELNNSSENSGSKKVPVVHQCKYNSLKDMIRRSKKRYSSEMHLDSERHSKQPSAHPTANQATLIQPESYSISKPQPRRVVRIGEHVTSSSTEHNRNNRSSCSLTGEPTSALSSSWDNGTESCYNAPLDRETGHTPSSPSSRRAVSPVVLFQKNFEDIPLPCKVHPTSVKQEHRQDHLPRRVAGIEREFETGTSYSSTYCIVENMPNVSTLKSEFINLLENYGVEYISFRLRPRDGYACVEVTDYSEAFRLQSILSSSSLHGNKLHVYLI